jgi:IclR family KDG regulon transcriptional repressor
VDCDIVGIKKSKRSTVIQFCKQKGRKMSQPPLPLDKAKPEAVDRVEVEPPREKQGGLQIKAVKGAAAFSKSIAILQMIADSEEPPSISTLVKQSGLPRPTLHRLLKALAAEDMVEPRPNKTYAVGARALQLAGRALEQNDLAKIAAPEMSLLCTQTQETIHLAIRSSNDLVYIYKKDTPHAVRIASTVGARVPCHASAIGKCLIAYLPESEQARIVESMDMRKLTEYTITDRNELLAEFRKIRENGFSTSHQESDLEIQCFGACIFDRSGQPAAGISISIPLYRLKDDNNEYLRPLLECRDRITQKLGGVIS